MSNVYRNPFKTGGPVDEDLIVYFIQCECSIWPVVQGWQVRVCGECREYGTYVAPPSSGRYERRVIDHGYEEE